MRLYKLLQILHLDSRAYKSHLVVTLEFRRRISRSPASFVS